MADNSKKAGIVIPSKNRSSFLLRQIRFYESVKCPHAIYIGDSSNDEHRSKIEEEIKALKNITVIYKHVPKLNNVEAIQYLLSIVKEPYACFIGDDDYQIPNSITKCIDFLEKNQDYATAGGYAVSFKLKGNGVYGELDHISNYPRPQLESKTARERIVKYFKHYHVPIFSVNRTPQMLKNWDAVKHISDEPFAGEIIPCALSIIAGKSKTLDCLSFVRHIHYNHFYMPNTFDWIIGPNWHNDYDKSATVLAEAIRAKDNISEEEARNCAKQGIWMYVQKQLIREYPLYFHEPGKKTFKFWLKLKSAKSALAKRFPPTKIIYRSLFKRYDRGLRDIHFDVTQKHSKYYQDFRGIMDSFTGK